MMSFSFMYWVVGCWAKAVDANEAARIVQARSVARMGILLVSVVSGLPIGAAAAIAAGGGSTDCFASTLGVTRPPEAISPHGVTGNVKVNVEPRPTRLFTQICPRCSSTNLRHKARPRPVPSDSTPHVAESCELVDRARQGGGACLEFREQSGI